MGPLFSTKRLLTLSDGRKYPNTENVLEILYGTYQGSKVNRSILAATGIGLYHVWRGSVLVVAMASPRTTEGGQQVYKDISLRDFRDVVDWLANCGNP
jgi:hypothetical protein